MKKFTILSILFVFTISVFSQTNTWQGDVSSNWHTSGNWSLNHIPTSSEDVVIPDVPGFNPNVYSNAYCRDLTVETGAVLNLYNVIDFFIDRDAFIEGTLDFNNSNIDFRVYDDITWLSGSSVTSNITGLASYIIIYDDWTFESGSNVDLTDIHVIFSPEGTSSSIIECNSSNSSFEYIYMNKSTGGTVLLSGASTQDMVVSWAISINSGVIFYSYSNHDIIIGDWFDNFGNFQFVNGGLVITEGNNPLQFNSGDFLNNLEFTSNWGTDLIQGNAVINGNLTINGDGLEFESTLELGGHFDNNAGSNTSIGQITFNGTDIQNVYSLDCETLILDKTAGELRFPSETSTCNNYDWEQGLYRVNGGTFIINDLVDNGIFGTISITAGQLDIYQDPLQFIDLNCTFYMTGGVCNIYGGSGDSWWSFGGNTSITMTDGMLDFKDNGVRVYISAYTFDENISGGIINSSGDFEIDRANFNPTGGNIWLTGPADCIVEHHASSNLYSLSISKGSDGYIPKDYKRKHRKAKPYINSKTNQVVATSELDLNGDFVLGGSSTFTPFNLMTVGGVWSNFADESAFNESGSEVIFDGDEQVSIFFGETFHDLTINKSYELGTAVYLSLEQTLGVNNDLNILDGSLTLWSGSVLNVGNDILIELNAGLIAENPTMVSTINVAGNWQNNNTSFSSTHGFNPGNSFVHFIGNSDQNIISNCPDGDFYNVWINSTAQVLALSDLQLLNGFYMENGGFIAPAELALMGNWMNLVNKTAFVEGNGLVVFNGSTNTFCTSEDFYHLEIDKPGAVLDFTINSNTSCQDLNWTAGGYELEENAQVTVYDLVDDGIYGDITINEGALLSITQGTGLNEYVDLNGNLNIDGGEVHVYGGSDISFWTWNGDVSITMTNDAGLYFEDVGIQIGLKEPFTFSENISGGEIHTASNFIVGRDNFTPTSSHLYMNGPDDAILNVAVGSSLSSLDINKSAKKGGTKNSKKSPRKITYQNSSKANHVVCPSDLDIQGDFTIHNGSFSAPSEMWVRRDWVNNVGEGAFIENTGQVTFYGAVDSEIKYDEVFYNLSCEKDYSVRFVHLAENISLQVLNDLQLDFGVFQTETGNTVNIGNNLQMLEDASWWAGNASINIEGDWDNQNTIQGIYSGFRSQNSTVTFNGMDHQYLLSDVPIEEFNKLLINKTGGTGFDSFEPQANIRITNDLDVIAGNWYDTPAGNVHELYGDVYIDIDGRWTDISGIVNLLGPATQSLINNGGGYFDIIMFNKDNPTDQVNLGGDLVFDYLNINTGDVTMLENYYLNHEAIFVESNASLTVKEGSWLVTDDGGKIEVADGGSMSLNGTETNHCVVTQNGGTGYYDFDIYGAFAAEYTEFRYMSSDGIYVHSEGVVNPLHTFNYCMFSLGQSGGTYLTIDSDQSLSCDGALFSPNNWAGNSNVRRTLDQGDITFTNFSGAFSGAAYEDDPFGRIFWDDGSRELELMVMLEGPFEGVKMLSTLNLLGFLPITQPYNISPWNYTGTENVASIPNTLVVDWILLEYRDAVDAITATSATTIGWQAALLLNNGNIVDLDGVSNLDFSFSINDNLFVVIHHRNHLPVMSANAIPDPGFVYTYNFTTASSQAYGTDAMKDLGGGVFGMLSGDANADGTINTDDITTIWSIEAGGSGYLNGDYNMDSQTDNSDKNDIWINNAGNSSQIPD